MSIRDLIACPLYRCVPMTQQEIRALWVREQLWRMRQRAA